MASNRDPQKDYRINRRGRKVTSSADRSKRSKKASAPKPTSSSTRSRGKGTGSKKVTTGDRRIKKGLFATRGDKLNRAVRKVGRPAAKVTESGGRTQRPPASNNNRKTNLKLKGTWANTQAEEMRLNKKAGANNLEASLINDGRLKQATDANKERSMRLGGAKSKIVPGPKTKAVRKKPLTGGPRGASGPATPPVQGPSRKTPNIVADIPKRTNKPKASGPPTPGVKFNPKNRVPAKPGMSGDKGLKALGAAALAGALSSGALRNPVSKAKQKEAANSIGKYNTKDKDGTVRSRLKVGPKKVGPKKVGTEAQSFDSAFTAARKAGKKTFTWKGKLYTTKLK